MSLHLTITISQYFMYVTEGNLVILFTQILSLIWPWPPQGNGHDLTCSIWGLWHLLTSSRSWPDLCRDLVSDAPPIQAPFINTRGTFKRVWRSLNFVINGYITLQLQGSLTLHIWTYKYLVILSGKSSGGSEGQTIKFEIKLW